MSLLQLAHDAWCLDSLHQVYYWRDDFWGDSIDDRWRTAGTGSNGYQADEDNCVIYLTSGAVDDNWRLMDWQDRRSINPATLCIIEWRGKLVQTDATYMRLWLHYTGSNVFGFSYDTDNGDTNFMCDLYANPLSHQIDSGVAADTAYHVFRYEHRETPTERDRWWIDKTLVATYTTMTLPSGLWYQPYLLIGTREAAAKTMYYDYVQVLAIR